MNKNCIFALLIALAIGGGYWYTVTSSTDVEEIAVTDPRAARETSGPAPGEEMTAGRLAAIEEITLTSVDPRGGTAVATRTFFNNRFDHTVTATMSAPAEGKFYEGWLVVARSNPVEFISTGKMESEGGDVYTIVYSNETDMTTYNQVVITEETKANGLDNVPETHIFEGTF